MHLRINDNPLSLANNQQTSHHCSYRMNEEPNQGIVARNHQDTKVSGLVKPFYTHNQKQFQF